jgi:hypothetical protein
LILGPYLKEENERNKTPHSIGLEETGSRRIWRRKTAARARLGGGRPEEGDGSDRWAPPVGLHERGERAAAAWAGVGRAREREDVGPNSAQRPKKGFYELFQLKQFVKCCFK